MVLERSLENEKQREAKAPTLFYVLHFLYPEVLVCFVASRAGLTSKIES